MPTEVSGGYGGGTSIQVGGGAGTDHGLLGGLTDDDHSIYQISRVFDVMRAPYSATGDGVADDRAAIQSAIDAAVAAGGGIVLLPADHYISDDLHIASGLVVLQGIKGKTKLRDTTLRTGAGPVAGSVAASINFAQTVSGSHPAFAGVRDVHFIGPNSANASQQKAISGLYFDHVAIEGCTFEDYGAETIWPAGNGVSPSLYWRVERCHFEDCGTATSTPSPCHLNVNRSRAVGNTFLNCYGGVGIHGDNNLVALNEFRGGRHYDIGVGGDGLTIRGNVVADNSHHLTAGANVRACIYVDTDAQYGVSINGGIMHLVGSAGAQTLYGLYGTGDITASDLFITIADTESTIFGVRVNVAGAAATRYANLSNVNVSLLSEVTANRAYGIQCIPGGAAATLHVTIRGGVLRGFTHTVGSYALDLNNNAGGTIQWDISDLRTLGGYLRFDDENWFAGELAGISLNHGTAGIRRIDSFDTLHASVAVASGETRYYNPRAGGASTTSENASASSIVPRKAVISKIRVKPTTNALAGGETVTFTVRKNNVDTSVSVVVAGGDSTGSFLTSTGAPVVFEAGDRISIKGVASALIASRTCTFLFLIDVAYVE